MSDERASSAAKSGDEHPPEDLLEDLSVARSSGDLQARIAAQVAVRRAAAPPSPGFLGRRRGRSTRLAPLLSWAIRTAALVLVALVVAVGVHDFLVAPFWIPSASMEPTLHGCPGCADDRLLVDKLSYRFHPPRRGDVVVFARPPRAPVADADLVKRVVGLPGETVSGHNGRVWVGGRMLIEPYVNARCGGTADFPAVRVPAGELFVMGDNRCNSTDSRVFGTISRSSVVGRALVIVWPLKRLHWL